MKRRSSPHVVDIGVLRHPCDLALVLFLYRHSRALLAIERLGAYIGYTFQQVVQSLDVLIQADILEASQYPTEAARLYAVKTPESGWLVSLVDIASTREGRRKVIEALPDAALPNESAKKSPTGKDQRSRGARRRIAVWQTQS